MRRLMLLRHAKSDWSDARARDHDRPLAERGRESAPKIGRYMAHHALIPDLVLASPAVRARQTWDLITPHFSAKLPVVFDDQVYEGSANDLLNLIRATKPSVHALLVVGHNPPLHDLAKLLIAAGDIDARQRLVEKLPTGALVVIDFAVDDWSKVHPSSGRLDRFVVPRTLERATD